MTEVTYYIFADGPGWTIQNDGKNYTGYRTRTGALRAAITIAEKLKRNGSSPLVQTYGPDGMWKTEWPTDLDPLLEFR